MLHSRFSIFFFEERPGIRDFMHVRWMRKRTLLSRYRSLPAGFLLVPPVELLFDIYFESAEVYSEATVRIRANKRLEMFEAVKSSYLNCKIECSSDAIRSTTFPSHENSRSSLFNNSWHLLFSEFIRRINFLELAM